MFVCFFSVVHLQGADLRPKALWHGMSFQNRSYLDCSSLFWIPEDTMPSS
jgi:hypothetical protein